MEAILTLLIPIALLVVLLYVLLSPIKLGWKLLLHGFCGFLCLWLLNLISVYTGILFPINPVTVLIAGFLGVPGLLLLALVQVVL